MNEQLELFVKKVISHNGIRQPYEITEIEPGRCIYFTALMPKKTDYRIRTWNIDNIGVDYTLFRNDGDTAIEIDTARYLFSCSRFYKRKW